MGLKLSFLIFSVLFLSGCTTLQSHKARFKIASSPEGADVFFEGKKIGRTPAYIEVPRQKNATLTLVKTGYPTVTKKLHSSYRWGDSFFANFVWIFYGAPVAWAIDYISGTAWDYDKVGLIQFDGAAAVGSLTPPRLIAIAPPQSEYELLSSEAGERLEARTELRFNASQVLHFDDTHTLFTLFNYTNDRKTPPENRDDLYSDLTITHLVESEATREGKDVVIRSKLIDALSDKEVGAYVDKIPASSFKNTDTSTTANTLVYLMGLVPNAVSFDISSPTSQIRLTDSTSYQGVGETTDTVTSLWTGIGLRSLSSPKLSKGIHPVFKLIPIISLSYDKFHFSEAYGSNTLGGYHFGWTTLEVGGGPEMGFETTVGYFYAEVAPAFSMNWISASGNGLDNSSTGSGLSFYLEAGYSIFASSRINLRLFARSESIPTAPWDQMLSQIGGVAPTASVTRSAAGLSIGYYFPEDRTVLKRAFFPY